MVPNGTAEQAFELEVPAVDSFYLFASLDGGEPEPGKPPSGSGGVGRLTAPVDGSQAQTGLTIQLEALPSVVPMPRGKAKGRPGGTQPGPGAASRPSPGGPSGARPPAGGHPQSGVKR